MGTWMGTKSTWSNRMVRGVILWNMISRVCKLPIDLLGQIGLTLLTWDENILLIKCCYPISSKHLTLLWRHFDRYLNIFFFLGQVSRALADGQQLVKCFQSASWVNWRSTLTKMSHYLGSYRMRSSVCQPGFRDPQQPTQWTIDRLLRWHAT